MTLDKSKNFQSPIPNFYSARRVYDRQQQ